MCRVAPPEAVESGPPAPQSAEMDAGVLSAEALCVGGPPAIVSSR